MPKGYVISHKSKDRQNNGRLKKDKRTKKLYEALHRKLKSEQHEPH